MKSTRVKQKAICDRFAVAPDYPEARSKLGITRDVRAGLQPVNGLRHMPENGTNGWYIWSTSTFPCETDAFVPLHVEHVANWNADVECYLALPPGWRFLIAPNYEDVWYDPSLIDNRTG